MVARFTATVTTRVPAEAVWARVTDWPAHGRWVPLTEVVVLTPQSTGVGARFVGRTRLPLLGLGFDDPMEITRWGPPRAGEPGRCSVVKQGRVLHGTADIVVEQVPGGGCTVSWREDVELSPLRLTRAVAPVFDPVLAAFMRAGFARTLRLMVGELERETQG
ncbi:SRPBCC family protein [Spongisporangium articulatum]|uniref:SRPBCC family protein n=1 Tax=Spongisporangium articulatum TaxID=3362603 RepID=A0ABW8AQ64_9ACTN